MKVVNPADIRLSVFYPVYNEEQGLAAMTSRALAALEGLGIGDWELIIVDDGSTDRSGAIADELASGHPRLRVIHHPKNLGYGLALRTGFAAAAMDYVFYTDGDIQYDLTELDRLLALIPHGDIIEGFRTRKQYTPYRHLMSFTYNLLLRMLFNIGDRDIDCSFKLYPRSLFERVTLTSAGAFIDAEVSIRARQLGLRTVEVGVTHFPRRSGRSTAANRRAVLVVLGETFRAFRLYRRQGNRL